MLVRVTTRLPAPRDLVWDTVKRTDTLRYITRGLLGFRVEGGAPERLAEAETYRMRLLFFGLLPAWRHEIRVTRLDEATHEIRTEERGGPIRTWRHRIAVDEEGWGSTRYLDEIEIQAGVLTPLVWFYAHVFYRYRQMRWRRLARRLSG
jgi:ligand-binding SRPBCC domain-containing protein